MNIYIAGLSYNTTDVDLNKLFSEYGNVSSAKVILDRETGRSRGFGFVEMTDEAEGQKAIEELNGTEVDQKVIAVSLARPRWKSHATLTLLATQDCPLWLQYD